MVKAKYTHFWSEQRSFRHVANSMPLLCGVMSCHVMSYPADPPRGAPPARDAMTALENKLADGLARIENELRESQHAAAAAAIKQVGVLPARSSRERLTNGLDVPAPFPSRGIVKCCCQFSFGANLSPVVTSHSCSTGKFPPT